MLKRPRKKRKVMAEHVLRNSLGIRFKNKWGEFHFENTTLIVFPDSGKRILSICSRFSAEYSRWFWGVPKKYWKNWGQQDFLGLIFQNEIKGFSFILLDPKESKDLFRKLGMDKSNNKKINMRIYMNDDVIRFQENQYFDVEKRMRPLEINI